MGQTCSVKQTTAGAAGTVATTRRLASRVFFDSEAMLTRNHKIPIGSGKVGIIQAHHQEDGETKKNVFFSAQNGRPVHSRKQTWNATRLRETECVMLNQYFTI